MHDNGLFPRSEGLSPSGYTFEDRIGASFRRSVVQKLSKKKDIPMIRNEAIGRRYNLVIAFDCLIFFTRIAKKANRCSVSYLFFSIGKCFGHTNPVLSKIDGYKVGKKSYLCKICMV